MARPVVMMCVERRDVAQLRTAIAAGHRVNACASFSESPLMRAARKNLVEVLLDGGAELEVKSHVGSTALFEACDCSATDVALLLVARGAKGDVQGALGRTPLQIAVKRGLVEVVRALLEAGQADPAAKGSTGKDALRYVPSRGAQAQQLRALLNDFASMENAVANAFLVGAAAAPLETHRIHLMFAAIQSGRADLFERVLLSGDARGQSRAAALRELRFAEQGGTTALHVAAYCGLPAFVEFLVEDCGMDPRTRDALRRLAIDVVLDARDPSGTVRALLTQATRRLQFRTFTEKMLACSGSLADLEELAQSLSSVHDIRAVFSLSVASLADRKEEMRAVVARALGCVIDEKLVFDDREALFCKSVLRECLRRELVTPVEFEYWNMQIVKVNMESATWVAALKQSVRRLDWRVADAERRLSVLHSEYAKLSDAVRGGQQGGASVGQSLSLFTTILGAIGDASAVFSAVLNLSSPQSVLAATFTLTDEAVAAFVVDPSSTQLVVSDDAQLCFAETGIDAVEFAGLLRDAILLERDGGEPDEEETFDVVDVVNDVADLVIEDRDEEEHEEKSNPQGERSNVSAKQDDDDGGDDGDLVAFPFHYAVKHSQGDLAVFRDVVEFIDPADGDVNASTSVAVDGAAVEVSAVVYASYLGYVDIVKWLLSRQDVAPTEQKFVTMQRAQQRAAAVAGP